MWLLSYYPRKLEVYFPSLRGNFISNVHSIIILFFVLQLKPVVEYWFSSTPCDKHSWSQQGGQKNVRIAVVFTVQSFLNNKLKL